MLAGYSRRLTRKSTLSTPANPNQTRASICSPLVEASEKGFSLDSITLDTVIQSVASAQLHLRPAHSDHPYAASPLRLPCSPIRPGVFLQIIVEDEQTTARGRPDRAYGNTVLPRRRLAGFPDQILFLSDDSRERRHP